MGTPRSISWPSFLSLWQRHLPPGLFESSGKRDADDKEPSRRPMPGKQHSNWPVTLACHQQESSHPMVELESSGRLEQYLKADKWPLEGGLQSCHGSELIIVTGCYPSLPLELEGFTARVTRGGGKYGAKSWLSINQKQRSRMLPRRNSDVSSPDRTCLP